MVATPNCFTCRHGAINKIRTCGSVFSCFDDVDNFLTRLIRFMFVYLTQYVMKRLLAITLLTVLLGSRCASPTTAPLPVVSVPTTPTSTSLTTGPAILEAEADGIGKATITGQTILVKIPVGYAKTTVRLTYKVTDDVKTITPASGTDIALRGTSGRTICIQTDVAGNCTRSYQLVIQTPTDIKAMLDPASRQLDVVQYLQSYSVVFQLNNLNAQPGTTRRFQLRFTHQATGYTYVGENYSLYDNAGNYVFIGQQNTSVPASGKLTMTGTLPLDMPTGNYALTVLIPTCYAPTTNGSCPELGLEGIDIAEPFVLRPGPPLVGDAGFAGSSTTDIRVSGRNFSAQKPLTLRFTNDFTQPVTLTTTIENEFLARATAPTSLSGGQYRLDVLSADGPVYATQFVVPTGTAQSYFGYVASLGNYAATRNWLPALPAFNGGETLEVRYANEYNGQQKMKAVRLIRVGNPAQTYELTGNEAFTPFSLAPDLKLWKWTLPVSLPKGSYALVFDDAGNVTSIPYFQAIRIE